MWSEGGREKWKTRADRKADNRNRRGQARRPGGDPEGSQRGGYGRHKRPDQTGRMVRPSSSTTRSSRATKRPPGQLINNRREGREPMKFTDLFIRRPVLATVISLLILVLGLRSLGTLKVREFPEMQNAVVTVSAVYTGADPALVSASFRPGSKARRAGERHRLPHLIEHTGREHDQAYLG